MTVRCVDDDGVNAGIHKGLSALEGVVCDTHSSCYSQAAVLVFRSIRASFDFDDIFVCDKSDEMIVLVNDRQFLDFMLLKDVLSCGEIGELCCCDEVFFCHHFRNRTVGLALEAEVTVCDDTHEDVVVVDYRDAADMIFVHDFEGIADEGAFFDCHRVDNHAVFSAFHLCDFGSLLLYCHVFVEHADAAFLSDSDSHRGFGYGIHTGSYDWDIQPDAA